MVPAALMVPQELVEDGVVGVVVGRSCRGPVCRRRLRRRCCSGMSSTVLRPLSGSGSCWGCACRSRRYRLQPTCPGPWLALAWLGNRPPSSSGPTPDLVAGAFFSALLVTSISQFRKGIETSLKRLLRWCGRVIAARRKSQFSPSARIRIPIPIKRASLFSSFVSWSTLGFWW